MKLILKIRLAILSHYFLQVKNGKFFIFEGMYLYMVWACMILTYGVLYHYNTIQILPFIIPFLFGAFQVFGKFKITENSGKVKRWLAKIFNRFLFTKINHIDDLTGSWRTQLRLLRDPKMCHKFDTPYDFLLEERLNNKFKQEYGMYWDEMRLTNLSHATLALLLGGCLFVLWFYS